MNVSAIGRSITALTVDPGDPTLITPTFSAHRRIIAGKVALFLPVAERRHEAGRDAEPRYSGLTRRGL